MKVERYESALHRSLLVSWLDWHDRVAVSDELLPAVGYVVEDLAMGFLYQTDSKLAQIETLITNPLRGKEERSAALDLVVEAIITEARAKGFTHLMGYTTAQAIVDRAVKHGFEVEAEKYTQVLKLL